MLQLSQYLTQCLEDGLLLHWDVCPVSWSYMSGVYRIYWLLAAGRVPALGLIYTQASQVPHSVAVPPVAHSVHSAVYPVVVVAGPPAVVCSFCVSLHLAAPWVHHSIPVHLCWVVVYSVVVGTALVVD